MKDKKSKILSPKQVRIQISSALEQSLAGLKERLGEKEIQRKIKKASKILANGVRVEV